MSKFKNFKKNWNDDLYSLVNNLDEEDMLEFVKEILSVRAAGNEIFIIGNGGSASIAEHLAVDFTNVVKVRCQAFTNPSLITCFSNDFGYENWLKKALENFLKKGDMVISISSSGESKNILNACEFAKDRGSYVATFSGFKENNSLRLLGDINFYTNSTKYNLVESCHHSWLLMVVDYIASIK